MMRFSHLTLAMLATLAVAPAAFAQDTGTTESASGKRFAVVGGYALSEPTSNPYIAGARTHVDGTSPTTSPSKRGARPTSSATASGPPMARSPASTASRTR